MSLTTVSSASFFNIPRVFGLGRGASPPPSPPRKQSSSPRKQSSSPQKRTSSPRKQSSSPRKRPSSPARARRPVSPPPTRARRPSSPPPTRARSPTRTRRSATTPTRPRRTSPARAPAPPVPRLPPTTQPRQPARAGSRSRSRLRNPSPPPPPPRRVRAASTISTLSSLNSTHAPPTTIFDPPPPPSWTDALRALGKSTKPWADRVDAWRVKVAAANTAGSQRGSQAGSAVSGRAGTDIGSVSGVGTNVSGAMATDVGTGVTGTGVTRTGATAESQTDLQSLSDEDIFALTQNIKNEEASRRPLVSPISPLADLRAEFSPFPDVAGLGQAEYAGPNANVLRKIDWLQKHGGWTGIRRTRGDGDCFYRSLAFAYVEKIMTAAEPGLAVATSLSHLESTLPLLEQAGFQKIVFEDFYEAFAELIQQIVPPNGKPPLTNESLLQQFQDPEISNSIVVFLRLLTSSYIRLSPEDDFTPFLFHPDTGEMIDVRTFVEMFVEATGREADHPQIMALSKALRVRIEVAYLDNSSGTPLADGTVRVDFVKFAPEGAEEDGTKPVVLLYRPGHYDTLEEKVDA